MALTANKQRFTRGDKVISQALAASSQTIRYGALLCWNGSGLLVPATDAASRTFAGVAEEAVATGSSTRVTFSYGHEEWIALSGSLAAASAGADACVASDGDVQDAASATFDVRVGRIVQAETMGATDGVWVRIRDHAPDVANIVSTTGLRTGPLKVANIPIGAVAYGSLGTEAVHIAGRIYVAEVYVPEPMTATGVAILNGATVGTDKLIGALYSSTGTLVASSALAGTTTAGADSFQELAFTAAVAISPGRYFLAAQCNGTTDKTRRIAAATYLNAASGTAGAFGTLPSITAPTTTAADQGPIGYVY